MWGQIRQAGAEESRDSPLREIASLKAQGSVLVSAIERKIENAIGKDIAEFAGIRKAQQRPASPKVC